MDEKLQLIVNKLLNIDFRLSLLEKRIDACIISTGEADKAFEEQLLRTDWTKDENNFRKIPRPVV